MNLRRDLSELSKELQLTGLAAAALAFAKAEKVVIRERIAVQKKRPDGRATDEIRPISIEIDVARTPRPIAVRTRPVRASTRTTVRSPETATQTSRPSAATPRGTAPTRVSPTTRFVAGSIAASESGATATAAPELPPRVASTPATAAATATVLVIDDEDGDHVRIPLASGVARATSPAGSRGMVTATCHPPLPSAPIRAFPAKNATRSRIPTSP